MSWLWLAVVCLVLILLGRAKVGGVLSYGADGLNVWVKAGPIRIHVWPRKKSEKMKQERRGGAKAPGPKQAPDRTHTESETRDAESPAKKPAPAPTKQKKGTLPRFGGPIPVAKAMLPLALEAAEAVWGRIRVDRLRLKLTVGADDPGDAALYYGWANGVMASFWTPITQAFHVVDGSARVELNFEGETGLSVFTQVTLRVYQVLGLGLHFVPRAFSRLVRLHREAMEHTKKKEAV